MRISCRESPPPQCLRRPLQCLRRPLQCLQNLLLRTFPPGQGILMLSLPEIHGKPRQKNLLIPLKGKRAEGKRQRRLTEMLKERARLTVSLRFPGRDRKFQQVRGRRPLKKKNLPGIKKSRNRKRTSILNMKGREWEGFPGACPNPRYMRGQRKRSTKGG